MKHLRPAGCVGLLFLLASGCRTPPETLDAPRRLQAPPDRPQLMFVGVASDNTFHHVAVASLAAPSAGFFVTNLSCQRVYFGGGRGICLTATTEGAATSWFAEIFDEKFQPLKRMRLSGEPSRVRVSPDGHFAAATVFESGHSYADHRFSTRTTIFDVTTGTALGDLEQFQTLRDQQPFHDVDFNFWGATFAKDSDTFYATLDTSGVSYLVKGRVTKRTMEVLRAGVECPSLSPDNTRIAFKRRVGARERGWWQLAVLELTTMRETFITAEDRSVDDQVEWLDDDRVMYHLTGGATAADLWAVRIDNTARPTRLLESAYSPAVVR